MVRIQNRVDKYTILRKYYRVYQPILNHHTAVKMTVIAKWAALQINLYHRISKINNLTKIF